MANFLQIKVRNRATNALIDTVTFTEMEIRGGIKKMLPYMPVVTMTTEGYARVWPRNVQTKIDFSAILETPESLSKINKVMVYMYAGHVFDLEILAGLQFYSQPLDALIRDTSESTVLYMELTAFDQDHRTIHDVGLEWRTECRMEFTAGKRASVPSQADFIAFPPAIGGAGN